MLLKYGGRVNSKSVLSPPSCDYSTLGELQDFIDQSFQDVILRNDNNTLPAQVIDSSTPLGIRVDSNSATIEEQFTMFKEIIESKVAALIAKFSEQIENIHKSKQELCKLTNENLNLKSRLAILEGKVFSEKKSTLPVGLGKCNDPPSGNFQPCTAVNKDTSFNAFHPCITSEMKARDNPLNYNNGYLGSLLRLDIVHFH
jgi:hypothetical protein